MQTHHSIAEKHAVSSTQERPRGRVAAVVAALLIGTLITASAIAGSQSEGMFSGSPFFKSQQLGIGFETNLW